MAGAAGSRGGAVLRAAPIGTDFCRDRVVRGGLSLARGVFACRWQKNYKTAERTQWHGLSPLVLGQRLRTLPDVPASVRGPVERRALARLVRS
jgi:hypothetical protein